MMRYNIKACVQPHALPHSSFVPFPSLRLPTPSGAVDKIVLPEGMQSVDFSLCKGLRGTAG